MQRNNAPNQLINSHSPYLLQHAYNPVHWREWSALVWEEARALNKPVIVSIGYSACHWCHVMEKESFEDFETAEIMNQHFICIKVDREERPDIDAVYMEACQQMTGRGGWPLNAICLPNQQPIYAGTYFPKTNWQNLLLQLNDIFKNNPAKAHEYGSKIADALNENIQVLKFDFEGIRNRSNIQTIAEICEKDFDYNYGGNLRVPKFIVPCYYQMLLDIYKLTREKSLLDFINFTFIRILNGGIYDHLRGGFYRYSTDEKWKVPHFEKMLYDNAQMIGLLSELNNLSDLELFKNGILDTLAFCKRELKYEGAYMAALDADSEGVEGKYYCFTYGELTQNLTEEELEFSKDFFDVKPEGNWEHGMNILHKPYAPAQLLEMQQITAAKYIQLSSSIREKLFTLQNSRVRPGLDNKVLSGWNGLMLSGISSAFLSLNEVEILKDIEELSHEIQTHFISQDGTLLRTTTNKISGFAEDYASVAKGFWDAYEATYNEQYLQTALALIQKSIDLFYREETGMFAFSGMENESLFAQNFDTTDDTIPSSNAMLCLLLIKAGLILNKSEWLAKGEKMINKMQDRVLKLAPWYSCWAQAGLILIYEGIHVAVSGEGATKVAQQLKRFLPSFVPVTASDKPELSGLQTFKGHLPGNDIFIQVCNRNQCFEPIKTVEQAKEILDELLGN